MRGHPDSPRVACLPIGSGGDWPSSVRAVAAERVEDQFERSTQLNRGMSRNSGDLDVRAGRRDATAPTLKDELMQRIASVGVHAHAASAKVLDENRLADVARGLS